MPYLTLLMSKNSVFEEYVSVKASLVDNTWIKCCYMRMIVCVAAADESLRAELEVLLPAVRMGQLRSGI